MLAQKSRGSVVSITAALVVNPIAGIRASVPMVTKGGRGRARRRRHAAAQGQPERVPEDALADGHNL
jgi:hypothetical protein